MGTRGGKTKKEPNTPTEWGNRSASEVVKWPLKPQQMCGGDSPRGGRVQFTDLVLCVLAQFPESPERCHFSPAHRRGDTATAPVTKPRVWRREAVKEEEEQSGFKHLPPARASCLRHCYQSPALCCRALPLHSSPAWKLMSGTRPLFFQYRVRVVVVFRALKLFFTCSFHVQTTRIIIAN